MTLAELGQLAARPSWGVRRVARLVGRSESTVRRALAGEPPAGFEAWLARAAVALDARGEPAGLCVAAPPAGVPGRPRKPAARHP